MEYGLIQVILLLAVAVGCILVFQRLHVPTSLAYLLVGVLLGPYTVGPVIDGDQLRVLAEFGIVFLLFTIGLNFSLPQLHALRHQVLGLGTAQVVVTTAVVGALAWLAGAPPVAAFVIGAVFAQSSTTIISKQLIEQAEENSRHGRLGTAISVFQDVTAVPFVVVIPVLGAAAGLQVLATSLGMALAKALLALLVVFFAGRWLLRPLFHRVAARRSAEVFTLTVLLVALAAAWITNNLGLSMAFGAFLAGMVLGETEFRHQVESAISPFRDVLLGLFFIGIGMLFDPMSLPGIWPWALLGATVLLVSKIAIVTGIVRWSGMDLATALRTGLLVAVGGEFGFALLAIALGAGAISEREGQIVLTSVLFSMIAAPFLIRYNGALVARLFRGSDGAPGIARDQPAVDLAQTIDGHVLICGYGRVGQSVAHFLEREQVPFIAIDLDIATVAQAHLAGEPVYYGNAADAALLDSVGLMRARLLVISHEDTEGAIRLMHLIRGVRPDLPVMVRTRDETQVDALRAAGATEVVPETLEAGLMIASHALMMLQVPVGRVLAMMQEQREGSYPLLRGYFRGEALARDDVPRGSERLRPIIIGGRSAWLGKALAELPLQDNELSAFVRDGRRDIAPGGDLRLQPGDTLVMFGTRSRLDELERTLR